MSTDETRETGGLALERLWAAGPVAVATEGRGTAPLMAARRLAARWRTHTIAIAALEPLPLYGLSFEPSVVPPTVEEERQAMLLGHIRRSEREAGIAGPGWPVRVFRGPTAEVLTDAAREDGARLLVMGIGRHRPIDRLLATETAVHTAGMSSVPVLAVTEPFPEAIRCATVGMDFGPASVMAAQLALRLLEPGGTLQLVHVLRRDRFDEALPAQDWQMQEDDRARILLERVRDALTVPAGITVRLVRLAGRPVDELLYFASVHQAELVAVGQRGLEREGRPGLGHVAMSVLRGATQAVLVAPEPPVADALRIQCRITGEYSATRPTQWEEELAAFTHRNRGRRTRLETDEPRQRVHVREEGFRLLGATYDRHDRRVALMLAAGDNGHAHLTRTLDDVHEVGVEGGERTGDAALRIAHGEGMTVLTLRGE